MATEEEYRSEMQKLLLVGGSMVAVVEAMPIAAMRQTVDRADDFGPFVDPTLWMRAQNDGRLKHQRAALVAAQTFVEEWRKAGLPVPGEEPE
jgi:hypothetical protein